MIETERVGKREKEEVIVLCRVVVGAALKSLRNFSFSDNYIQSTFIDIKKTI